MPAKKKNSEAENIKEWQRLAALPSPAAERAKGGDWAKVQSPTPEEQRAESLRDDAIRELKARHLL